MTADGIAAHEPVMVAEVTGYLRDRKTVLDMTVGAGGHAGALLDAGVDLVVGVDRDPSALALAVRRLAAFGERFRPVASRFSEVDEAVPTFRLITILVGSRVLVGTLVRLAEGARPRRLAGTPIGDEAAGEEELIHRVTRPGVRGGAIGE